MSEDQVDATVVELVDELLEDETGAQVVAQCVEVLKTAAEAVRSGDQEPSLLMTSEVIGAAAELQHRGEALDVIAKVREQASPKKWFDEALRKGVERLETEAASREGEEEASRVSEAEKKAVDAFEGVEGFRTVMMQGGKYAIRRLPDGALDMFTRGRFIESFGHRRMWRPKGPPLPLAPIYWDLEEGAEFQHLNGIIFAPPGVECAEDHLNLWTGWKVEPCEGAWPMIEWHLREVIAGGDRRVAGFVLDWLALAAQTGELIPVVIVLRGDEGAGKGLFVEELLIRRLWGNHGLRASKVGDVIGSFNAHLEFVRLLFLDDTFFSGDAREVRALKNLNRETIATLFAAFPVAFPPAPGAPGRPLKLHVDRDIRERAGPVGASAEVLRGGRQDATHDLYQLTEADLRDWNVVTQRGS